MAKTLRSQCRGPGFDPWSGNWIPHATKKTQHNQINKYKKIFLINYLGNIILPTYEEIGRT